MGAIPCNSVYHTEHKKARKSYSDFKNSASISCCSSESFDNADLRNGFISSGLSEKKSFNETESASQKYDNVSTVGFLFPNSKSIR
ncbi:MAG: hypothetical protein LIO53_09370 [Oscillospiraceae bacterium]|nr:hypothetical protein [Oscillospiraceae bacterium]